MRPNLHEARPLVPWNKGRLVGQKAPLKLKEIRVIRIRLQLAEKVRDLALFNLAIDSKLRGCARRITREEHFSACNGHAAQDASACAV